MRKWTVPIAIAVAATAMTLAVTSSTSGAAGSSYAEDRSAIEDLQARYLFASAVFDGFGHYEDELVKVKGQWLFSKRRIYNEQRREWAYPGGRNPAW